MLSGWRDVVPCGSRTLRIGARVLGCTAVVVMGLVNVLVGCTSITEGNPTVDAEDAPVYRASVSASIAASAATSSLRETQRQRSLTTKAIHSACESLATSSNSAIDSTNKFVEAFNSGGSTAATEGPAKDALNNSADVVAGSLSDALAPELRDLLNAWVDAARTVANNISTHAPPSEFNRAVDQLNDTRAKALKLCRATY